MRIHLAVLILVGAALGAGAAAADTVQASYGLAGTQSPAQAAICNGSATCILGMEDFDSWKGGAFSTDFGTGNLITGSYSGGFQSLKADEYGGTGGSGRYPELYPSGGSYSLTLSTAASVPGVNYFGLWFSALDAGSTLKFFDGSNLVYTLAPAQYISMVGACPSNTNSFCGNPNTKFAGQDSGEQFAFLNFTDVGGYFTKIEFDQSCSGGGFESDNHTVGYLSGVNAPEPSSLDLAGLGILFTAVGIVGRRRFQGARSRR